jgi:hypothetical protein
MPAKNRGKRPPPAAGKVAEPAEPPDYDNETPKFCLNFLREGFDVHALSAARQAAFAKTLQKLACLRWKELVTAPRHGQGTEPIPARQIKAPIPAKFADSGRFVVFRYDGKLP